MKKILVCAILLLLLPGATAWLEDKVYDEETQTVTIRNWINSPIVSIQLANSSNDCLINCSATVNIHAYKDVDPGDFELLFLSGMEEIDMRYNSNLPYSLLEDNNHVVDLTGYKPQPNFEIKWIYYFFGIPVSEFPAWTSNWDYNYSYSYELVQNGVKPRLINVNVPEYCYSNNDTCIPEYHYLKRSGTEPTYSQKNIGITCSGLTLDFDDKVCEICDDKLVCTSTNDYSKLIPYSLKCDCIPGQDCKVMNISSGKDLYEHHNLNEVKIEWQY